MLIWRLISTPSSFELRNFANFTPSLWCKKMSHCPSRSLGCAVKDMLASLNAHLSSSSSLSTFLQVVYKVSVGDRRRRGGQSHFNLLHSQPSSISTKRKFLNFSFAYIVPIGSLLALISHLLFAFCFLLLCWTMMGLKPSFFPSLRHLHPMKEFLSEGNYHRFLE